jgi:ribose transport system permease protein
MMMSKNSKGFLKKIVSRRGVGQVLTAGIGLIIISVVFAIINPIFGSWNNISNLLRQIAPILIIGIGQSYVLITGNIDLSIGSVVGMSCMMSATLMTRGVSPLISSLITFVACMGIGLMNGFLVARFKMPPFIATLGSMTIARGIAQLVNNNYNTDSIGENANTFRDIFYYGKTVGIYNPVWIALILWLIFNFVLSSTKSGRHLYAVGSNEEAARFSGVSTFSTIMTAYLVSAFCSMIVGLVNCATSGAGTMDSGTSYEMYAVAASVIGGVSTLGGTGILSGTVVGASIWGVLQNGLQFAGAPLAWRNIVVGVIVIISVLLDVVFRMSKKVTIQKEEKQIQ